MNNITKEVRNEIITEIFRNGLTERYSRIDKDGEELLGYYLLCPNKSYGEIRNMKQLERLFINAKKKAGKAYGKTNESDFENQLSECYMYVYMAFDEVFRGDANVEDDLKVETVEDIYKIINNEQLASKLCRWCITYVDMRMRTFVKQKSNPDYWADSYGQFNRIDYLYLDKMNEDGTNPYDEIAYEEAYEEETGDFSEYIIENYVSKLTSKQQLFVQTYIWFGTNAQGHIEDNEGHILYIKQEVVNYRKAIAKKILRLMNENDNDLIIENKYGRYSVDWRGDKKNE